MDGNLTSPNRLGGMRAIKVAALLLASAFVAASTLVFSAFSSALPRFGY